MKDNGSAKRKALGTALIAAFLAVSALLFIYIGMPFVRFAADSERFRLFVQEHFYLSRIASVLMLALQVVVAVIPGEPLELAAGYAFGGIEGTLICLGGIALGSTAVFFLVRSLGMRIVRLFFTEEKIKSLKYLQNNPRQNFLIFLIFLIPGTPKDLITYFVGLTDMDFKLFFIMATLARLPSVVTSTVGGDAIGSKNYGFADYMIIFTAVISLIGYFIYRRMSKKETNNGNGENGRIG